MPDDARHVGVLLLLKPLDGALLLLFFKLLGASAALGFPLLLLLGGQLSPGVPRGCHCVEAPRWKA